MAWHLPKGVEYDWIAHGLDSPSPARKLGPYHLVAPLLKALLATLREENDDEAEKQEASPNPNLRCLCRAINRGSLESLKSSSSWRARAAFRFAAARSYALSGVTGNERLRLASSRWQSIWQGREEGAAECDFEQSHHFSSNAMSGGAPKPSR